MAKMKGGDPDKGPPMKEGAHQYDKGYETDNSNLPDGGFPGPERGNRYKMHQNEIVTRDSKKLKRGKFTKIA